MKLQARWQPQRQQEPHECGLSLEPMDATALLEGVLSGLNLSSKQGKWRQYDHEVKGLSVIKPLVGKHRDTPADATVMRVHHGEDWAILLAEGIHPRLADIDAGAMAAYVVDLATRRIIAGGGRLGQIAGLDNFCWPDPVQSELTPDGEQKLAALVRACQALAAMCEGLSLPCISGKDSMKNDSIRGGVKISIPPTLLFSTLGWIADCRRALDLVVGGPGEMLYLLGDTRAEWGGSELLAHLARRQQQPQLLGNRPPRISPEETRAVCATLEAAVDQGLVRAAHAPHLGGLAVGLAMLSLAADRGLAVQLEAVPTSAALAVPELLFCESGSRFLVSVAPADTDAFEALLAERHILGARIGQVTDEPWLRLTHHGRPVVEARVEQLRARFQETLDVF
jgi:phosphoribosylformylglycinamidine synthase